MPEDIIIAAHYSLFAFNRSFKLYKCIYEQILAEETSCFRKDDLFFPITKRNFCAFIVYLDQIESSAVAENLGKNGKVIGVNVSVKAVVIR